MSYHFQLTTSCGVVQRRNPADAGYSGAWVVSGRTETLNAEYVEMVYTFASALYEYLHRPVVGPVLPLLVLQTIRNSGSRSFLYDSYNRPPMIDDARLSLNFPLPSSIYFTS